MEFLDAVGWTSKANDLERVFSVNDTYQVVPEVANPVSTPFVADPSLDL